jgi:hypothetical protein
MQSSENSTLRRQEGMGYSNMKMSLNGYTGERKNSKPKLLIVDGTGGTI